MERKRKKAESKKRRYDKVKAAGGREAWALHREQHAQQAYEARPKQTAAEVELEVKRMEKKRKKAESNARRSDKVKAAGGRSAWAREPRSRRRKRGLNRRMRKQSWKASRWKGSANVRSTGRKTSISLSRCLNRRRKLFWKPGHSKLC